MKERQSCDIYRHVKTRTFKNTYKKRENYPNPEINVTECGNTFTSFVCDPGKYIPEQDVVKINRVIAELKELKKCSCVRCEIGEIAYTYINVAVAIVPNVVGEFVDSAERLDATKSFARYLREHWAFRVNDPCDNDVVIVFAIEQKQTFTDMGKVAQQEGLTPACTEMIFDTQQAKFDNASYGDALLGILNGYKDVLVDGEGCVHDGPRTFLGTTYRTLLYITVSIMFIGVAFLVVLSSVATSMDYGGMIDINDINRPYRPSKTLTHYSYESETSSKMTSPTLSSATPLASTAATAGASTAAIAGASTAAGRTACRGTACGESASHVLAARREDPHRPHPHRLRRHPRQLTAHRPGSIGAREVGVARRLQRGALRQGVGQGVEGVEGVEEVEGVEICIKRREDGEAEQQT